MGRTIQKNLEILLLVLCVAVLLIFIVPIIIYRFFGKKDKDPDLEDPSSPKTPIEPGSERLTIMPDINKDTHIVRSPYSSAENAHREAQNQDNNLSFKSKMLRYLKKQKGQHLKLAGDLQKEYLQQKSLKARII